MEEVTHKLWPNESLAQKGPRCLILMPQPDTSELDVCAFASVVQQVQAEQDRGTVDLLIFKELKTFLADKNADLFLILRPIFPFICGNEGSKFQHNPPHLTSGGPSRWDIKQQGYCTALGLLVISTHSKMRFYHASWCRRCPQIFSVSPQVESQS